MPYFERALQYRREHGYRRGIVMALANIGLVKYYLGESSVCLDYAYEALNLVEKIGARPNKAKNQSAPHSIRFISNNRYKQA